MPWTPSIFAHVDAKVWAPLEVVLSLQAKVFVNAVLLNCDDNEV